MTYRGFTVSADKPFIIVDNTGKPYVDVDGKLICEPTKQQLKDNWIDNEEITIQPGGRVFEVKP